MMFRFPSVICTRCTGFFCLAIIKGPPNDIYCIIEEPYKHYFTEKVSYSHSYVGIVDIPTDEEMREMEREYMRRTTRQTA